MQIFAISAILTHISGNAKAAIPGFGKKWLKCILRPQSVDYGRKFDFEALITRKYAQKRNFCYTFSIYVKRI